MGAKRIQISVDNGVTFRTFPGSTGEKRTELQSVNDTIFGQSWQSENPNIGQTMITCNGFFKGVAGYTATVKQGGTPTTMTAEACSLVSGKTYKVTNVAKQMFDYSSALTILDNAVDHTADVLSIDYLNGTVTFKPAYTVTGPVTVTGKYIPLAALAKAKGYSVTQTAAEIDDTTFELAAANNGWRVFEAGLKTVSLEISGIYDASGAFYDALLARQLLYLEISPNGSTNTFFRGFFKGTGQQQSGDVGALEATTLNLTLSVPDGSLVETPFKWYFTSSVLSQSVQDAINAWQNGSVVKVKYLPDGTNGTLVDAIITEASLSNNVDGQNEFRFSFRGSGQPTATP